MGLGPGAGRCEVCEEGGEEGDAWGGVGVYDWGAQFVEGGVPLVVAFTEPWNSVVCFKNSDMSKGKRRTAEELVMPRWLFEGVLETCRVLRKVCGCRLENHMVSTNFLSIPGRFIHQDHEAR